MSKRIFIDGSINSDLCIIAADGQEINYFDYSDDLATSKKNNIYLGIHYFPSNHNNGKLQTKRYSLPITDNASKTVVSLPIFPELKKIDQLKKF